LAWDLSLMGSFSAVVFDYPRYSGNHKSGG